MDNLNINDSVTFEQGGESGKSMDSLKIRGYVTIWQGEGKDKKVIVERRRNKWVDAGLKGLLSWLLGENFVSDVLDTRAWAYNFACYLGDDTTTPTTHNLTALASPIGAAPGTAPNSTSGEDRSNPSTGTWHTAYIAIWDAEAVSGTVGEVALYLRPYTDITAEWTSSGTFDRAMVSRCSDADGDFSSFTIDTSKSLTVYWEVQIAYE